MIINFDALIKKSSLREMALKIAEAGYEAIEIPKVVSERINIEKGRFLKIKYNTADSVNPISDNEMALRLDLDDFKRVFLIGIGKGSSLAALTLLKILLPLGHRFVGGVSLDTEIPNPKSQISNKSRIINSKIKFLTGTHPLPSRKNVEATKKIIKLAKNLKKDDLLITFVCGGGSALLCGSEKELKYSQTIFKELTKAGADIKELNTVRKHLSDIKGGGLAKLAYPATVISLIISDVPTANNDLSMVASGPTVYDKTAKKDAEAILKKHNLRPTTYNLRLLETPKDKKYFKNVKNILFFSNREPILAMARKAKKLGFESKIYSLKLKGEARKALIGLTLSVCPGEAAMAGGETTVTLKKSKIKNQKSKLQIKNQKLGKGGRNMEAVLSIITNNLITNNLIILSIASDGRDNTEAAGAIGDILTLKKAQKLKLNPREFLNNHNSFNFFKKTGDLIFTKKNSFNVADLMLVLSESKE